MRYLKRTAIALAGALLLLLAPAASAQRRVTRVIIFEPVPDPFFWGPVYYVPPERVGYVKLQTELKDAKVYVDGGFAGRARELKKFALAPGSHNIVLKDNDDRPIYQERVAVLLGKTTKIRVG